MLGFPSHNANNRYGETMSYRIGLAVALALGSLSAQAGVLAVKAAHLVDVDHGKIIDHPVVLVDGERITAVGRELDVPADATVIDLGSATLLPGLIDVHEHLTADARIGAYESLGLSIPAQTLIGVKNARVTLEAGFTSIRNVGADGFADVALRDAINRGDIPGPRMRVSGPLLGITGGH